MIQPIARMFGSAMLLAPLIAAGCASHAPPTSTSPSATAPGPAAAPATVEYLELHGGKPPLRWYSVRLTLRNATDGPRWYVWRYYGDDPLPADDQFKAPSPDSPGILEGDLLDGAKSSSPRDPPGHGKARLLHFLGQSNFRAARLPAGASLTIQNYDIECWKPIDEFEVWETAALIVNGKTPLEDLLPAPSLSDKDVLLPNTRGVGMNLNWDYQRGTTRPDWPAEPILTLRAEHPRRWTVPIAGIEPSRGLNPWR